jgi:hypothetical protein
MVKAIASVVGNEDAADAMEWEFQAGLMDNRVAATRLTPHMVDVHLDDIRAAFARAPRIQNIREVVDTLKSNGDHVMLGRVHNDNRPTLRLFVDTGGRVCWIPCAL